MAKKKLTAEQLEKKALSRAVMVQWVDACGWPNGWRDIREVHANACPEPINSIGYVLKDDKDMIVLVQSVGGGDVDNVIAIPKSWVLQVWEIEDNDE